MTNMNETPQSSPPHAAEPQGPADVSPPIDSAGPFDAETNKDARLWAMICHLASFAGVSILPGFGYVIGPLVVWLIKKNEFPFVDEQGKEAVNFQITMFIYSIAAGLLIFACIGVVLLPAVTVVDIVFIIIAAIKVNDGQHYRYPYPLIIHFIK